MTGYICRARARRSRRDITRVGSDRFSAQFGLFHHGTEKDKVRQMRHPHDRDEDSVYLGGDGTASVLYLVHGMLEVALGKRNRNAVHVHQVRQFAQFDHVPPRRFATEACSHHTTLHTGRRHADEGQTCTAGQVLSVRKLLSGGLL